jgi:hypothetical protein
MRLMNMPVDKTIAHPSKTTNELHPFATGTLVTVINAHGLHGKWFGIVMDRRGPDINPALDWSEYSHIHFLKDSWYYLVFGPGFIHPYYDRWRKEVFIAGNLQQATTPHSL